MASRSPEQIRASMEVHRSELAVSLERLRYEVVQVTDWRRHLRRNRTKAIAGAAVAGFVIGGGIAGAIGVLRRGG